MVTNVKKCNICEILVGIFVVIILANKDSNITNMHIHHLLRDN